MNQNIDLDVNNYTTDELFTILNLSSEYTTKDDVTATTNKYTEQFNKEGNHDMALFFQDIQYSLNNYLDSINNTQNENEVKEGANDTTDYNYASAEKQTSNWFQNQALTQSNTTQNSKVTDRKQKIDVYDNQHVPIRCK